MLNGQQKHILLEEEFIEVGSYGHKGTEFPIHLRDTQTPNSRENAISFRIVMYVK